VLLVERVTFAYLVGYDKTDHAQRFAQSYVIGEKTAPKVWRRFVLAGSTNVVSITTSSLALLPCILDR
jgi:hypothetical protein